MDHIRPSVREPGLSRRMFTLFPLPSASLRLRERPRLFDQQQFGGLLHRSASEERLLRGIEQTTRSQ